jgi:hypothetical protein
MTHGVRTFTSVRMGRARYSGPMSSAKMVKILVAAAGVAIAATVGYLLHGEAKKRYEARAVVSIIGEATAQLNNLKTPSRETLDKVDGDLRMVKGWSNPDLADAAEQYLLGAREILRRRFDANRMSQKAAASRAALSAHMMRAAHRDTSWIRTALDLKKQVERDHYDLDVQLNALADLLDMQPQANKRLAPHVQASLLLEDSARRSTRRAVLEEAKRARVELEDTRALLR